MAIAKHVASGVVVAALVLGIGVFALVAVGPRTGSYRTLTVLSSSMRPALQAGALAIVRPIDVANLEVGDVITYRVPVEGRQVVTHRIIEIIEDGERPVIRTKGDANDLPDPWVARLEDDVAWKLHSSVPVVGYAINTLRRPPIANLLVLGCPLLISLLALAGLRNSDKQPIRPTACPALERRPGPSAARRASVVTARSDDTMGWDDAVRLWRLGRRGFSWTTDVATGRRWQQVRAHRA